MFKPFPHNTPFDACNTSISGSGEETPSQATLRLEGDLDSDSIASFRDAVFTAIGGRPGILLLDLSAVPFVDTAGLATLVTVARVAKMVQVAVVVRPGAYLRHVLDATGLRRVFTITDPALEEE